MSLLRLNNSLPSVFDRFFENDFLDWSSRNFSMTNTTLPSVNIKETAENYDIELAAPGFEKEDFKLQLDGDVLSISSEKKSESESSEERFTKREFSYQSFCRSFTLPQMVEPDKILANYNKGILHVIIPKKEETRPLPARTIEIS